jgi:hypothetical protein
MIKEIYSSLFRRVVLGLVLGVFLVLGAAFTIAFSEPKSAPTAVREPVNALDQGDFLAYGRGWVASSSGDSSTPLTEEACASATNWEWFEDGNGDGDTTDEEDGICVLTVAITGTQLSWNGYDYTTNYDNTYIAAYECEGNFPNGTVKDGTYSALVGSGPTYDTTWNSGDCALCEADCFDGRRDLPAQGSYIANVGGSGGYGGPITPEVLKSWKGTRIPTFNDFYGFCGYKDGGSNYETGCSADTTIGDYGGMVGRTDECLDLSNSASWEWLSGQVHSVYARIGGVGACSISNSSSVNSGYRFRAVFRP